MMKHRQMSSSVDPDTWGWLVTTEEPVRMFSLRSTFTVGRNPSTCDLFIDQNMFDEFGDHFEDEDFVRISRKHFSIEKKVGDECAVLTDLSMNGTFVHGVRVGKDRKIILEHCSVISLLGNNCEVFRYMDRDTMEDLHPSHLTDKYIVGEILGKGTSSVVRRGYKTVVGKVETYALKVISRKDDRSNYALPTDAKMEIRIMESLHHPCILRLYEVFTSPDSIILVMERASGGELFEAIVNDRNANKISEQVAKAYFYQIVHCVNYLHQRKLCHRDLKLENILIGEEKFGNVSILKVADFGLSKSWSGRQGPLRTYVGTPVYMAPEVSRLESGKQSYPPYTHKVDCWSLGVILYTLLAGRRPFKTGINLHDSIMAGRYVPMEGVHWDSVSNAARSLVKKLLDVNPETRWSTEQVLAHRWFVEDEAAVNAAKAVMYRDFEDKENFDEE